MMKIEYHDGIRIISECSDEEYRELLIREQHIVPMDKKCEICHYNNAVCVWKDGKRYCEICRRQAAFKMLTGE